MGQLGLLTGANPLKRAMTEGKQEKSDPKGVRTGKAVRAFSLALHQNTVYGPNHRVTRQAMDAAYGEIAPFLDDMEEMIIGRIDDSLVVNGMEISVSGPIERALLPAMTNLSLDSFIVEKGLVHDDFVKLIQILAKGSQYKPGEVSRATFKRALEVAGVNHVDIHHIRYERVRDNETVVPKEIELAGRAASTSARPTRPIAAKPTSAVAPGGADAIDMTRIVSDMLDRPDDLSRALLGVLAVPQTPEQIDSFLKQFAKALEKAFAQIPVTPTALKTAARQVSKLCRALAADAETRPEIDKRRIKQLEEMLTAAADALKVEMLAEEYRKKREALEKSEKRIAGFIRRKQETEFGQVDLRERLAESGMSFAEWSSVQADSRKTGKANEEAGAIERIAAVAAELRSVAEMAPGEATAKAMKAAEDAGRELTAVTDSLMNRIGDLVKQAREPEEPVRDRDKPTRRSPKQKLLADLAEIAQELCQPLSVIVASLDMVASSHLGEVNECQISMLRLAAESAERMRKLVYSLMDMADVPKDLKPDRTVISQLY